MRRVVLYLFGIFVFPIFFCDWVFATISEEMILMKGGCFIMGQSDEEMDWLVTQAGEEEYENWYNDERPAREVCLGDYYIGKHEITVGEFREFVNETGYKTDAEMADGCKRYFEPTFWKKDYWKVEKKASWNNPGFNQKDEHPVVCISWNDTQEFIKWVNLKSGREYRLPTEAEWEYAAKGGKASTNKEVKYFLKGNIADEALKRKFPKWKWEIMRDYNDNFIFTAPVESFEPNEFGLYDMGGNASEWVGDFYEINYYSRRRHNNPKGPSGGRKHVIRDCAWACRNPFAARFSNRGSGYPSQAYAIFGFRVAISFEDERFPITELTTEKLDLKTTPPPSSPPQTQAPAIPN